MRQPLVAGNWKMNGSLSSIDSLVAGLKSGINKVTKAKIAVCPSYIYLNHVATLLEGSKISLGAQNICDQDQGAFTGEVSGPMLKEFDCEYVLIGHSERRQIYGESDQLSAEKFVAAQRAGITPILCVGETLEQRESGVTEKVVESQLQAVIELAGIDSLANAVIAYEPVWAIGTGKTASPQQAQDVHAYIRQSIAGQNEKISAEIAILYGGSVKGSNAAELFAQEDIDGGLIGGASLKSDEFLTICQAAG